MRRRKGGLWLVLDLILALLAGALEDYRLPGENRATGCFVRAVTPAVGLTGGSRYGAYGVMLTQ